MSEKTVELSIMIGQLVGERDALRTRVKMLEDREQLACLVAAESGKHKLEARRLRAALRDARELIGRRFNPSIDKDAGRVYWKINAALTRVEES